MENLTVLSMLWVLNMGTRENGTEEVRIFLVSFLTQDDIFAFGNQELDRCVFLGDPSKILGLRVRSRVLLFYS